MERAAGPYLATNDRGYYEVRWTEGRRSRRVSTGTKDVREAQLFLAGFILEQQKYAGRAGDKATVADVLRWYWDEHVLPNVIAKKRIEQARARLVEGFGDLPAAQLTPADVARFVEDRRAGRLGRRKCGDAAIRKELGVLIAACNHAVRTRRISAAPYIKMPPQPEARDRWLTREEAGKLLEAAARQHGVISSGPRGRRAAKSKKNRLTRLYRFVMLGLETAARPEAIQTLRWDQVDLHRRLIALNPSGRRQTKKRRPVVPISDALLPVLRRAWGERVGNGEWVLDHPGSIRRSFATAAKAAGLTGVTPYTLRHTWATWAALDGVELWKIAKIMGDTMATVERNYAHHHPDYLRDAVNREPGRSGAQIGAQRPDQAPYTPDTDRQRGEKAAEN